MFGSFVLASLLFNQKGLMYEDAAKKASEEGRNLVVIVGANGCMGCDLLKRDLKNELGLGRFGEAVVVYINKDTQPELASRVAVGETMPQIAIFKPVAGVLRRSALMIGRFSPAKIREELAERWK